jgi:hypothetical protein
MRDSRVAVRRAVVGIALVTLLPTTAPAQVLSLPPRPGGALSGSEIVAATAALTREAREQRFLREYRSGNVPAWLRTLVPVTMTRRLDGGDVVVTVHVTPDYLALGSNDDWFLTPLSPRVAQRMATETGTSLPTPPMVDAIWRAASARLGPDSIAPSAAMVTIPVFARHNALVRARRDADPAPLGALVAGHKKDVVLTPRLDALPDRVAIYGWHRPDGRPIQPLYTGHGANYADYSHGIRLVDRRIMIDGHEHDLLDVLRGPALAAAVSNEGAMSTPTYRMVEHE